MTGKFRFLGSPWDEVYLLLGEEIPTSRTEAGPKLAAAWELARLLDPKVTAKEPMALAPGGGDDGAR